MAESKIFDGNFYQVYGWMLNQLGLKGTALQVYAIIYGFSQDGESCFCGSLQYLCDFTGTSKPTVLKALCELCDRGLVRKTENMVDGTKRCSYTANAEAVKKLCFGGKETLQGGSKETLPGSVKKLEWVGKETLTDAVKKLERPGKETLPNNKVYNIADIKEDIQEYTEPAAPAPPGPERHKYGKYGWVRLTDDEYGRLVQEAGAAEAQRCIRYVDEAAQSTGNKNKWKDWNLVVRKCHREGWGLGRGQIRKQPTGFETGNPFLEMLDERRRSQ